VAAMSRAVEDLASRIATGIEHSLPNHRNVLYVHVREELG
jgi:hypothetical protein